MTTNFTPYPWKIVDDGDGCFSVVDQKGETVCRFWYDNEPFDSVVSWGWEKPFENATANVRLAAASPVMYELLMKAYDTFTNNEYHPPNHELAVWKEQVKAVILQVQSENMHSRDCMIWQIMNSANNGSGFPEPEHVACTCGASEKE